MTVGRPLLTSLPLEILLIITDHMEAFDLVQFSRTCRVFSHFGGCKSIAKAFMRDGTADDAIESLEYSVTRMDLVVELFRHVKSRKRSYSYVAYEAARLNDIKQLEVWHDEFGFIPPRALDGAARTEQIGTFEFVKSRIVLDDRNANQLFNCIGECGNRALLDHLRTNYPELVTPERLVFVVNGSAAFGVFDFALEIFESLPPRKSKVIVDSAAFIARGAAIYAVSDLFREFINMYRYDGDVRNQITILAAVHDRVDFLQMQEESENAADSFSMVITYAVHYNHLDVAQYLLASDEIVHRTRSSSLVDALRSAIGKERTEMVPLLLARVPQMSLLHDAALSESLDEALMLLRGYGISDQVRSEDGNWKVEFDDYSDDIPDWKLMVWMLIFGLDRDACSAKSRIYDGERARYQSILPAAIDLARELGISDSCIYEMVRFVRIPS
jgi:hypothetical protein